MDIVSRCDVIDVMVSESADLKTAEESIRFMIEIFTKESGYSAKPIKYKLWNRNKELSGISDAEQQTEMISLDEALRNGAEAMHERRKSKGTKKSSLDDMLEERMPFEVGTLFDPEYD